VLFVEKSEKNVPRPNFDEAIRATEAMLAEEAMKETIQTKHTTMPKIAHQEIINTHPQETDIYKPIIWKSILCVIPCMILFFLSRILFALLIYLVALIISKIPMLNNLLGSLNKARDGDLSIVIHLLMYIIPVFGAYCITILIQDKMMKHTPTKTLSKRILGIIMATIHTLFLVANIIGDGSWGINICCIIASLGFIFINDA
jgi:hypothetical protein